MWAKLNFSVHTINFQRTQLEEEIKRLREEADIEKTTKEVHIDIMKLLFVCFFILVYTDTCHIPIAWIVMLNFSELNPSFRLVNPPAITSLDVKKGTGKGFKVTPFDGDKENMVEKVLTGRAI